MCRGDAMDLLLMCSNTFPGISWISKLSCCIMVI